MSEVVFLDLLASGEAWRLHRGWNLSLLLALSSKLRGLELLASRLLLVPFSLCLALRRKDLIGVYEESLASKVRGARTRLPASDWKSSSEEGCCQRWAGVLAFLESAHGLN